MNLRLSDEERAFERRISDMIDLSERHYCTKYSAFLNEREQLIAENAARSAGVEYALFGGYDGAVRKAIGIGGYSRDEEDFPIKAVTFTFRKADALSHRDFLGALMSMNIKRELIGDILTGEGYGIVFCTDTAQQLMLDEITKVGRVGVTAEAGIHAEIPESRFAEISGIVSSLRADSVAAIATGLSREKAALLIKSGKMQVNCIECDVSAAVSEGDRITINGFGKFILDDAGSITKKDRIHIRLRKFI